VSSNDKTSDLLVATTRATKAEASAEKPVVAEQQPVAKKAPAKKTAAKKKAAAKKTSARKAPARKRTGNTQKEELVSTFTFGRRVWPD